MPWRSATNIVLFLQQAQADEDEPAPALRLPEHLDQKQVQGTVEALGRELFQARSTADVRKVAHSSIEVRNTRDEPVASMGGARGSASLQRQPCRTVVCERPAHQPDLTE